MRRLLLFIYVCLALPVLTGCGATLSADRHDVERLLLIQTMGLDSGDGRLTMSVSSGLGPEDRPSLVMAAGAASIEDAIARLQNYSPENQLFYAHVQYLLLGEDAARSELQRVIQWVDRSPTLRMDTDMLVVKGTAKDAVVGSSQQSTDITQRLASLDRQSRSNGWTMHTLREVAAATSQGDGALCMAVSAQTTEDRVFSEDQQADAVIPEGYAVLDENGLVEFLDPETSMGAEFLTGDPTGFLITVSGDTLEILDGAAKIEGRFDETGKPVGIAVRCEIHTGVLEKAKDSTLSDKDLEAALSRTAGRWVRGALGRAQATGCDFLGLRAAVLGKPAAAAAWWDKWGEIFPALPVTVEVEGHIDRSYDLAD